MRITGGTFRNRKLNVPKGRDIRPTSDKVRQAIFNSLQSRGAVADAVVMDGFCGTGALGLEALSRGASFCTFIDKEPNSLACCRENTESILGKDGYQILGSNLLTIGETNDNKISLLFLDPPYRRDLASQALNQLHEKGWLADEAVCVVETESGAILDVPENFVFEDQKIYGDTQVLFYSYKISA